MNDVCITDLDQYITGTGKNGNQVALPRKGEDNLDRAMKIPLDKDPGMKVSTNVS